MAVNNYFKVVVGGVLRRDGDERAARSIEVAEYFLFDGKDTASTKAAWAKATEFREMYNERRPMDAGLHRRVAPARLVVWRRPLEGGEWDDLLKVGESPYEPAVLS